MVENADTYCITRETVIFKKIMVFTVRECF